MLAVVIFLAVVGAIAGGVHTNSVSVSIPSVSVPAVQSPPTSTPTPSTPGTASSGSLLHQPAFAAAVKTLAPLGSLTLLRVASDRLDATLALPGQRLREAEYRSGSGWSVLATSPGATGTPVVARASVDTSAPARIAAAAQRRLHRAASTINYLVLLKVAGSLQWETYFTDGAHASADAHGRGLHVVS